MTINDAYNKIFNILYKGQYSPVCIEDKNYYIFMPRPNNISEDEEYFTGVYYPAVNKKTGEILTYNILNDTLKPPIKKIKLKISKY